MCFVCIYTEWMNFHYIRHTPSSNKVIKQACVYRAEYMNSLETHIYPANKPHC